MTSEMAAWRVTYTPGEWLVLSGPTMLVVMLPAPPRMSQLVNTLWDDILAARSVDALLQVFGQYGLDGMSDFAAFFWDAAGLHGMARGQLSVTDVDTGDTVVDGSDVVTWREESLGTVRRLRVGMQQTSEHEHLQLPLVVGAVMASAIHLSTDPEARVQFPEEGYQGLLASGAATLQPAIAEDGDPGIPDEAERSAQVVGLGDETEMEPFSGSLMDDEIPLWTPPNDEGRDYDGAGAMPIPPPASAPVVGPHTFQPTEEGDDSGAVFSDDPKATHKPAPGPDEHGKVLAVQCARGHANPPGSRGCRICSAPVDAANPRLIDRPVLAGVHSNHGDFVDVREAVVVGRSPNALKGPPGAHLMRVPSPGSDISRNHLMVAAREWSLVVTDLGSTNGTTVLPAGKQPFVLAHGESVQVELGTVLDLGDGVSLRIEPPRG